MYDFKYLVNLRYEWIYMDYQIQYKKYEEGDFDTFFELVQRDEVMKYVTGKGLTEAEARAKFDSDLLVNKGHPSLGYFWLSMETRVRLWAMRSWSLTRGIRNILKLVIY